MASTDLYDVGETVILRATFRDDDGELINPATTTLYIERPDGTVDTKTDTDMGNPSTGVKTFVDTCEARGITWWRYVGVLGSLTVVEQDFYVGRQQHAPAPVAP